MIEPHWTRPYTYDGHIQRGPAHLYNTVFSFDCTVKCFAECGELLFIVNSENEYKWLPVLNMPENHCEKCERIGIMRELAK